MNVDLQINNSSLPGARFVTWAPAPCRVRVTDPAGAAGPTVTLTLSSVSAATAGAVMFRSTATGPNAATLNLTVPVNGTSVSFFVVGKPNRASSDLDDVQIDARVAGAVVGSVPVMVRIRKNAMTLSPAERDRFIAALATLNDQGLGRFSDFRDMHMTTAALRQAHGAPGFLPWHRIYMLDLERELQAIDPSVSLPYWRFDQPAPDIFTRDFLGESDSLGTVRFNPQNPLQFWKTDNVPGIMRRPLFNTAQAPAGLFNETQTLNIATAYTGFWRMEGNPHGSAHTSFGGIISSANTAPRDPLFFLLHCNVDRLWAKWQKRNNRFDPAVAASYTTIGLPPFPGHGLNDTMWPWDGITGGFRPPTAPGGALASSPVVSTPGPQPRVRDCLDYQGNINPLSQLGFGYDDIPW